jgi:hypothetical protein
MTRGHVLLTVGQIVEPVTGRRGDPPTSVWTFFALISIWADASFASGFDE